MSEIIDMAGKRCGLLTVIERGATTIPGQARWRCICDCGNEIVSKGFKLRNGIAKSCGCHRRERMRTINLKHGGSKTPQYTMFYAARKRAVLYCVPFSITPADIQVPKICPVLGVLLRADGGKDCRPSLDRLRPELGYVPGNVRVISWRANRIKSDASLVDLERIVAYMKGAI